MMDQQQQQQQQLVVLGRQAAEATGAVPDSGGNRWTADGLDVGDQQQPSQRLLRPIGMRGVDRDEELTTTSTTTTTTASASSSVFERQAQPHPADRADEEVK